MPITWCIPPFRADGVEPDERFRRSNSVHLTGARVRFSVKYQHTFQLRIVCYTPGSDSAIGSFDPVRPDGLQSTVPYVSWKVDWKKEHDEQIMPGGPFAETLLDRQRDDGGVYRYESGDGCLFGADVARGGRRPKGDFCLTKNVPVSGGGTQVEEINWYVDIGETVEFEHERSTVALRGNYQFLVYCDPVYTDPQDRAVGQAKRLITMSPPSVTVYYR